MVTTVTGLAPFAQYLPSAGLPGALQSWTDRPGITVIRIFKALGKHSLATRWEEDWEKRNKWHRIIPILQTWEIKAENLDVLPVTTIGKASFKMGMAYFPTNLASPHKDTTFCYIAEFLKLFTTDIWAG